MTFCKHLSGVENYLKNNEVLELEYIGPKEEILDFELTTKQILTRFKEGVVKFLNDNNSINCYQSSFFSDYVFKYCIYIDRFLDDKEAAKAFELVIGYMEFIKGLCIYSVDDAEDIDEILINYLITLATGYDYFENLQKYLLMKFRNVVLDGIGEEIIDRMVLNINTREQARIYISLLEKIKVDDYQEEKIRKYIGVLKNVKG